jgi:hypothetical protein
MYNADRCVLAEVGGSLKGTCAVAEAAGGKKNRRHHACMRAIMKMTFDPNAPNVPDAAAELRNGSRAYLVGRIGLGPDGLRADVIEVLVTTLKRTAGPRS